MAFDESLVTDILHQADIVKVVESYIPLVKKGKDYIGKCPFHNDTNPSMHVSPEKQIFKCFVCNTSGNAISFVMKHENIPFKEALKKVAEICGIIDPRLDNINEAKVVDKRRVPLIKCLSDLTVFYQYTLNSPEGKECLDYFESRHLDANLRNKFKLGYAIKDGKATCKFLESKNHSIKTMQDAGVVAANSTVFSDRNQGRAIFPIFDPNGEVVGFSARRIGEGNDPKYINSPATYLFNTASVVYKSIIVIILNRNSITINSRYVIVFVTTYLMMLCNVFNFIWQRFIRRSNKS